MDASIIVPALNEEKYIRPCLESICAQDFPLEWELIVSDGGSADRTREIASACADRVVAAPKGIFAGRNAGAAAAKGTLLVFVDADTVIPKNYVSTVWVQWAT